MTMAIAHFETLPQELVDIQVEVEAYAHNYGLDFFPTVFELIDADHLNAIAAYGGFSTRFPHWRFGMKYERLSKGYHYGLQRIYELVINNNPCYAYLMTSNETIDQKLVMAHVYGHCDFFKNNHWFSQTNRKMMDEMANHGNRIRRHMDRFGVEVVEEFIDACLSIEDLIDIHAPFIKRKDDPDKYNFAADEESETNGKEGRFRAKSYMDSFINPPEVLAAEAEQQRPRAEQPPKLPDEPERDVMGFVLNHAPLKTWQADVLAMLRDEAYYFAPQGQTKIMNEGWASYWHSKIMTRQGLTSGDVINYCDHHSGTLATSRNQLNPYKLGIELFRDIEDRWNKGQFGKDYDDCTDASRRREWNTNTGLGREKIFEVRRIHNDLTFIDTFLTLDFCREYKMFQFGYRSDSDTYVIESREFPKIKSQLLENLTNLGRPQIAVQDANYKNRGELFLKHTYRDVELKMDYARDTLANLHRLWDRPVHIETVLDNTVNILSYDGTDHSVEAGQAWEAGE